MSATPPRPTEPVVVITRRTLRRVALVAIAAVALVGVGIGAFYWGRAGGPSTTATITGTTITSQQSTSTTTPLDEEDFYIPSTAMYPTLKAGETVVVDLTAYAASPPRTGDIIVFKRPPAENCGGAPVPDLVKRVVGLPGQTVSARGGQLYVTGKLLKEPWLPQTTKSRIYTTMTNHVKVPKTQYFVIGDNRINSCDSRDWGTVKSTLIVGKVVKVISASATTTTTAAPPPTATTAPPAAILPDAPTCSSSEGTFEPAALSPNCGGSSQPRVTDIYWLSWTAQTAYGGGSLDVDLCTPDCAAGPETTYGATITLSSPTTRNGQMVFACMTVTAGLAPQKVSRITSCTPSAGGESGGWGET